MPQVYVIFINSLWNKKKFKNFFNQVTTAIATTNKKNGEPNIFLFNNTVNICKLRDGMIGGFLVQTMFNDWNKYVNIPLMCPFKKV